MPSPAMIFLNAASDLIWNLARISMYLVALKALITGHWPWETCECCGKKWREHKQGGSK